MNQETPQAAERPARVPLHEALDLRPLVAANGQARVALTVAHIHLRSRQIVHGGVFAALLDAAQGMAAASQAPAGHDVVTMQLNVNFLRPASVGDELTAAGEVIHSGRRTAVTRGEVRNQNGDLTATGTATLMYLSTQGGVAVGGIGPDRLDRSKQS